MPRSAPYALRWHAASRTYLLYRGDQPSAPPIGAETPAWFAWLQQATSFSFAAADGATCTLRKESRMRGGTYWSAYRRVGAHMTKRYLGRDGALTIACLETTART